MYYQVFNDIIPLAYINNKYFKNNQTPLQTDSRILKILDELLQQTEIHSRIGFGSATIGFRSDLLRGLSDLSENVKGEGELIAKVQDRIISVWKTLKNPNIIDGQSLIGKSTSRTVAKPAIGLKMAFFGDHDDPAQAFTNRIKLTVEQQIPFMIRSSMIRGMDAYANFFSVHESTWDVYRLTRPIYQSLLLFLPKSLHWELSEMEKLKQLDLAHDGTIEKVVFEKALVEMPPNSDMEAFRHFFVENPKKSLLLWLLGHGGANSVGGLYTDAYHTFLHALKSLNCKGLTISTCGGGGQSLMFSIPWKAKEGSIPKFETFSQNPPFMIVVRSIGDFSRREAKAELKMHDYLETMTKFLESPGAETYLRFRKLLEANEKDNGKTINERVKVCFPQPQGYFRPLGESGSGYNSFSITYSLVKQCELRRQKPFFSSQGQEITVTAKDCLDLHPIIIDVPIICQKSNPILLSMIPGSGFHFLHSLKLDAEGFYFTTLTFFAYVSRIFKSYQSMQMTEDVTKSFFIGKVYCSGSDCIWEDVIIVISSNNQMCFFRQEHEYFRLDVERQAPSKISLFEYIDGLRTGIGLSLELESIYFVSGGQEGTTDIEKAIKKFTKYYASAFKSKEKTWAQVKDLRSGTKRISDVVDLDHPVFKDILYLYLYFYKREMFIFDKYIKKDALLIKKFLKYSETILKDESLFIYNYNFDILYDLISCVGLKYYYDNNIPIAAILKEIKIDPIKKKSLIDLGVLKDPDGFCTPLEKAVYKLDFEAADKLVDAGACFKQGVFDPEKFLFSVSRNASNKDFKFVKEIFVLAKKAGVKLDKIKYEELNSITRKKFAWDLRNWILTN